MNWRQLCMLKTLFAIADRDGVTDDDVTVLQDAPPEDVAFMERLIREESVVAYRPKKGYSTNCYLFGGITDKGRKAYGPIVEAENRRCADEMRCVSSVEGNFQGNNR